VNRALRAATMGVLLLSPVVLSACSAGQVTQTATQQRDKTGAQAQVGDISLRQAELLPPRGGSYAAGDDADLQVAIINGGTEADTLVRVAGNGFGSAEIQGPTTGTSASTSASPSTSASASTSASPSTSADSSTSTSTSTSTESRSSVIEIPAGASVFVGGSDYNVTLKNLRESLTTGQYLEVTFTFRNAGEVTIPVTVANPGAETRGKAFDFHGGEG
jgi:copper(I)-binding protein